MQRFLSCCLGLFSKKSECLHCRYNSVFVTQCASRMEKTRVLMTPFKYFEWKAKIMIRLRSKGLYRVTMGTETDPNSIVEKDKQFNRLDEAFVLLCLSTSRDILFHVDSLGMPNEFWINLEPLFGKTDEMRGHQLENELISLSPSHYETIQDFFTKFQHLCFS